MRPSQQRKGFGEEIVSNIENLILKSKIDEIRVAVGLKNWNALIFWTKYGYNRITKISGDTEFDYDKFATIELCKNINKDIV